MFNNIRYWIYHTQDEENLMGVWRFYYIFGKKVNGKLKWFWNYE